MPLKSHSILFCWWFSSPKYPKWNPNPMKLMVKSPQIPMKITLRSPFRAKWLFRKESSQQWLHRSCLPHLPRCCLVRSDTISSWCVMCIYKAHAHNITSHNIPYHTIPFHSITLHTYIHTYCIYIICNHICMCVHIYILSWYSYVSCL